MKGVRMVGGVYLKKSERILLFGGKFFPIDFPLGISVELPNLSSLDRSNTI